MSKDLEVLIARKELLATRASLQRLQAELHIYAIRESMRWPRRLAQFARWVSAGVAIVRILRR